MMVNEMKIKLIRCVNMCKGLQYSTRHTMETLYSEIRKYLFLFQIFGFCPFGRNQFQDYLLGLYSLALFVALVALFVIAMFINKVIYDNNSLSAIVAGLVFLGETLTHVISLLHAFVSRKDLKNTLAELNDIDDIFENKLHKPIDYQILRKKHFYKFTVILLITKGLLVFLLIFLSVGARKSAYAFWLHLVFSLAAVNIRCIQTIFFVDLLHERLEFLNHRLVDISNRNGSKKSKLILYVESYDPKKSSKKSNDYDEFNEILALKQIYGMIWNASKLMNESFGWSILAIVTRSFIGFTSHGYWLFLGFEDIIDSQYIVDSATIFSLIALLLTILCLSCYNCSGCAEETGVLLNKIEKRDNNEPFNDLAREFSLQILHEPIIISANGFFTVNLDLLGSLAAATVTYLVILIQFQLSEKDKQTSDPISGNLTLNVTGNASVN